MPMFHLLAQCDDRARVGAAPRVDLLGAAGEIQEECHPQVSDEDVDREEHTEQVVVDIEHFFHRRLIRAAADPATGKCRHAFPHIARDSFGADPAPQEQRDRAADNDAKRPRQKQDQRFRTELRERREIDRQRQQNESRRQQVARRDRIQRGLLAIDDAERVVQRRKKIAKQQRRHIFVESAPERMAGLRCPEDRAKRRSQQAENDSIVCKARFAQISIDARSAGLAIIPLTILRRRPSLGIGK
jgi:hypothetical protein